MHTQTPINIDDQELDKMLAELRAFIVQRTRVGSGQPGKPRQPSKIVYARELADILDIGMTTLYRWRKQAPERLPPEIPAYGGRLRWLRDDVTAFLRGRMGR